MKVYFLSDIRAALKLDGEYVGIIDNFERYCEIDSVKGALCEIVPDGNLQPLNFFMDGNFFRTSHSYAEVYTSRAFNAVYVRSFYPKDTSLKVLLQRRFADITVTIYSQCGLFLSCEGKTFENYPLPYDYADPHTEEVSVCGKTILAIYGGKWLTLIDKNGKLLFMNEAESCSFGNTLEVTAPLRTCENSIAQCSFTLDGGVFKAVNHAVLPRRTQGETMLAFTFFERVLYSSGYTSMLCDELKAKAGSLKKYLGDFTAVTAPDEDFYKVNDEKFAAGLVYHKGKNLYEIIYYALDEENGKITNVRPV